MAIPNKEQRNNNSDIVGNKLYGKNWDLIIDSIKNADPIFAEFLKEIPYGSVYPRDSLSLKSREIAAISVLTQLNLKPQLKSHIIGGLNVGITREEIKELILHLAMFIGYPLAMDALRVAKEVFEHEDSKSNLV